MQVRGKKKLAKNTSSAVPVRLLKDLKTFGKKGMLQCLRPPMATRHDG